MVVKPSNPVAKAAAYDRRQTATRIARPKKGKGSYTRKHKETKTHGRIAGRI